MVGDFLFESSDHENRYQSAHSENGKWPGVKLKKKNYVGKESSGMTVSS